MIRIDSKSVELWNCWWLATRDERHEIRLFFRLIVDELRRIPIYTLSWSQPKISLFGRFSSCVSRFLDGKSCRILAGTPKATNRKGTVELGIRLKWFATCGMDMRSEFKSH